MSGYLARMVEQKFEELVLAHDAETGLKAIIAIHSTARGPALGGTRMWTYPDEEAAIDDAMCLARGMSYKSAAAELPLGGGKAVIIGDPCTDKSEALFRAYGRFVAKMNGRFITAADMGTAEHDLDCMRMETEHIVGGSALGSPSPYTAYGVWKGIKACADVVFGSPELEGLLVAVQGVGTVGAALCKYLSADKARLVVADIDKKKAELVAGQYGAQVVVAEEIIGTECSIFAPCGSGGVVNTKSVPRLQCRIVAGAANNVIKEVQAGIALRERGIVYAPDYIINAGGITFVEMSRQGGMTPAEIRKVIDRIEVRVKEILIRAAEQKMRPEQVADLYAEEKLLEKI